MPLKKGPQFNIFLLNSWKTHNCKPSAMQRCIQKVILNCSKHDSLSFAHTNTYLTLLTATDRQTTHEQTLNTPTHSHQHLSCVWTPHPFQTLPDKHGRPLWTDTPVTTETQSHHQGYKPCLPAPGLWVAARLSLGALKQLMRARRTKEGVGKTREWTVCAKGKQMEFFFYIFCLSSAPSCEWLCYNNGYLCIVRVLYLEKKKKR